jgi:hypothetical protein
LSPDNPSDSSETGYVVTTRVVTDQPVSNEGVESSGDNLTDKQQEEDDSDTSFDVEEF